MLKGCLWLHTAHGNSYDGKKESVGRKGRRGVVSHWAEDLSYIMNSVTKWHINPSEP